MPNPPATDLFIFQQTLEQQKRQIDQQVNNFAADTVTKTAETYGPHSVQAVEAYTHILSRGGKRIRGAMTMAAYQMFGGQDQHVALQAALVMEMIQAYLLIMDDICDRSTSRRGGPTAHLEIETAFQQASWKGDAGHFGRSIAMLSAMYGLHQAMVEVSQLPVAGTVRAAASEHINASLTVTIHGQFQDLYNQVTQPDRQLVERLMVWKTAHYTFISPLHFGAILAQAPTDVMPPLLELSTHAGRVFQLSDDLIGIYGVERETGKNPLDDLREGKFTLLIVETLERLQGDDRQFIQQCLGNPNITLDNLTRCQQLIESSGAKQAIQNEINRSVQQGLAVLTSLQPYAKSAGIQFLSGMMHYLAKRTS